MAKILDQIDIAILAAMQRLPAASQREIADIVNLSQNACWRRIRHLEETGIIEGRAPRINREALGLGLVVFTMIRTRHHSDAWLRKFRAHVEAIPEVMDFFRIGGEYDYMLKIVTADMAGFDSVYRRLIEGVDLETVTSHFAMEAIAENRSLPLQRAIAATSRR